MIATLMRLQVLQSIHGGKGVLLGIVVVAPMVLALLYNLLGGFDGFEDTQAELAAGLVLFALYTQFTCIIAGLFYGSSIISTELDWKTITYLFTRPIPKWRVILGKYLGLVAILVPALLVSAALAWVVIGMPLGALGLVTFLVLVALATTAYTALFAAISAVFPKRAIVVGLLWGGIFEWALTFVPALISQVTVTFYTRGLGFMMLDKRLREMLSDDYAAALLPEMPVWQALLGIVGIIAVSLTIAFVLIQKREFATHND